MPNRTRQPNTSAPERQGADAIVPQGQTSPAGRGRRRKKKRPPLSTVLFPKREQRVRRRRQRSTPDNRAERRRQRLKRQQRYRFFYKVFTLVLILCAGVLALTLFFKVDQVRIQGRSRYSNAQLLETAAIEQGDNLFLLSRRAVRKRLFDEYPYLDTVIVERKMPNQIIIRVADATPAAAIGSDTTYYYMDADGKLLEQVSTDRLGSVPVVTGITVDDVEVGKRLNMRRDERLRQLTALLRALEEYDLMDRVDFINLSDMENVRVGCDGHMYIRFGTMDELDYKMRFAQKFVAETSASLYCEIEVSGEILWEGRPSYRVIPVSAEEVAMQSRDLDEAILIEPTLPADPDADPNADPNAEPGADPDAEPDAEPNDEPEPAPAPLPQSGPPSLAGSAPPAGDGDAGSDSAPQDGGEAGNGTARPSRYVPGNGGTNWRTGST